MNALIDHPWTNIYRFPVASNLAATEEAGAKPIAPAALDGGDAKEQARSFLKAARKDLTEEEARSTAGVRWLQYDADRLEQECNAARIALNALKGAHEQLTNQFHDQRVELASLKGTGHASVRNEILANLCLAAGSAGLGVAPGYFAVPAAAGLATIGLVVSGLLVLGGISCRVWK